MKYYDAFSATGFHSAFLTTFSFGAQAFEDIALPRLRAAGCRNVHVIADEGMVNQEFSEIGPPKAAGTHYHLIKEKRDGAFHPKILLQLGRKKARLMIGSANLTAPGLAGNLELVSVIECEGGEDPTVPIIVNALEYISQCVARPDEWFREGLKSAVLRCPWLNNVSGAGTFTHPDYGLTALVHDKPDVSILNQFARLIDEDAIHRLTVISPYWDERLVALKTLANRLGEPEIRIAIERERQLFPKDATIGSERLTMHDLDVIKASRCVHAKLVIAEGQVHDHVLSGSMNCSIAALMHVNGRPRNAEAGLYRRLPAGTAVSAMNIAPCFDAAITLEDLPEFEQIANEAEHRKVFVDGGSITKHRTELWWHPQAEADPRGSSISVYGANGMLVADRLPLAAARGNQHVAHLTDNPSGTCYGIVHFADGKQSAPVAICDLIALPHSAREAASGNAQRLLASLDDFDNEDLQIIEILIDLQNLSDAPVASTELLKRLRPRGQREAPDNAPQKLTYKEFLQGRDRTSGEARLNSGGLQNETDFSEVRHALNRILGIVTGEDQPLDSDHDPLEDDLGLTEPTNEDPDDELPLRPVASPKQSNVREASRRVRLHTASQIVSAVSRFTSRFQKEGDKYVTLADLIHLRALLQVLLAFALPRNEQPSSQRVLPAYEGTSSDWPRLVGQVIQTIYRHGEDPFATLEIPGNLDTVPDAVLECWAAVVVSLRLAIAVVKEEPNAAPVRTYLEKFQGLTAMRIKAEISGSSRTNSGFMQFLEKFETRFNHLSSK